MWTLCRIGNDYCCNIFAIFAVTFQRWQFYNSKFYFRKQSISKIPNSKIIEARICPDIETSKPFYKANILYSIVFDNLFHIKEILFVIQKGLDI